MTDASTTCLLRVELPPPDHRVLGPNGGHGNRHVKAAAVREYKGWAALAARSALGRRRAADVVAGVARFELRLVWTLGPGAQRLDDDNAKIVFKSARDAIAEVLGVNDNRMCWARDVTWLRGARPEAVIEVWRTE